MENQNKTIEKLEKLETRCNELERLLADSSVIDNSGLYGKYVKEFSDLQQKVLLYRQFKKKQSEIAQLQDVPSV